MYLYTVYIHVRGGCDICFSFRTFSFSIMWFPKLAQASRKVTLYGPSRKGLVRETLERFFLNLALFSSIYFLRILHTVIDWFPRSKTREDVTRMSFKCKR